MQKQAPAATMPPPDSNSTSATSSTSGGTFGSAYVKLKSDLANLRKQYNEALATRNRLKACALPDVAVRMDLARADKRLWGGTYEQMKADDPALTLREYRRRRIYRNATYLFLVGEMHGLTAKLKATQKEARDLMAEIKRLEKLRRRWTS